LIICGIVWIFPFSAKVVIWNLKYLAFFNYKAWLMGYACSNSTVGRQLDCTPVRPWFNFRKLSHVCNIFLCLLHARWVHSDSAAVSDYQGVGGVPDVYISVQCTHSACQEKWTHRVNLMLTRAVSDLSGRHLTELAICCEAKLWYTQGKYTNYPTAFQDIHLSGSLVKWETYINTKCNLDRSKDGCKVHSNISHRAILGQQVQQGHRTRRVWWRTWVV